MFEEPSKQMNNFKVKSIWMHLDHVLVLVLLQWRQLHFEGFDSDPGRDNWFTSIEVFIYAKNAWTCESLVNLVQDSTNKSLLVEFQFIQWWKETLVANCSIWSSTRHLVEAEELYAKSVWSGKLGILTSNTLKFRRWRIRACLIHFDFTLQGCTPITANKSNRDLGSIVIDHSNLSTAKRILMHSAGLELLFLICEWYDLINFDSVGISTHTLLNAPATIRKQESRKSNKTRMNGKILTPPPTFHLDSYRHRTCQVKNSNNAADPGCRYHLLKNPFVLPRSSTK